MRRRRSRCVFPWLIVIALLAGAAVASAADEFTTFTLPDPSGDDHGDGSLLYPMSDDYPPHTLDLVSFGARRAGGGTQFEVIFARPVLQPIRRAVDGGGTQLTSIARHGFYTFNVDVYIDTDRVPGSGRTAMLPGRRAEVSADSAWEKVVCLTPRPDVARSLLERILTVNSRKEYKAEHGTLPDAKAREIEAEIGRDLDRSYFFPTRIEVLGSRVRFFVPDSFLGGPASAKWAYVVAVSATDLSPSVVLGITPSLLDEPSDSLMILPLCRGRCQERFGSTHEDIDGLPPLVDITVPPGSSQEALLRDYDIATGRPVRLPGVVPSEEGAGGGR